MAASYGTLYTLDTLKSTFQGIGDFGTDNLLAAVRALTDAHNKILNDMFNDLVEPTTDTDRIYGTNADMEMTDTDEFGRADAQKYVPGAKVGFPLKKFTGSLQWTRDFLEAMQVADLAIDVEGMFAADRKNMQTQVKKALFSSADYTTTDTLAIRRTVVPIEVRALLNADGLPIPAGPNGESFDGSTHTHYLGTASLTASDVVSLLDTVLEHSNSGTAVIYINKQNEAAVKALSGFTPLSYPLITEPTTGQSIAAPRLQINPIYNRLVGYFQGAEIWVKPWIPAGYILCFLRDVPKVLCMRTRRPGSNALVLADESERWPLTFRTYMRECGFGVWNRHNAAILFIGGSSYTDPTF